MKLSTTLSNEAKLAIANNLLDFLEREESIDYFEEDNMFFTDTESLAEKCTLTENVVCAIDLGCKVDGVIYRAE